MTAAHRTGAVAARTRIAVLWSGAFLVAAVLVWQAVTASGAPDPVAHHTGSGAAVLDIGVLVFREGLECVLVLAAITASMVGDARSYRRPIAVGVAVAVLATLATWRIAVGIIDSLTENFPALQVQAATGLLAIVVLLLVMNWFFHRVYWTGWIAAHTQQKQRLMRAAARDGAAGRSAARIFLGLAMLGFTSFYREGFEVVLFLQSYRLKLGDDSVLYGVLVGSVLSGIVAVLTLVAQRRLPYKMMLIATGVLLGGVLLVMVGEQAQEMQLARWLPTTPLPRLSGAIPPWMGLWFAVFPTVETLAAQLLAGLLVVGSYLIVRHRVTRMVV